MSKEDNPERYEKATSVAIRVRKLIYEITRPAYDESPTDRMTKFRKAEDELIASIERAITP